MDDDIKKNILKSGTTVLGIVCKDGVVVGADRRATAGTLVYSKKERKIEKVNDYVITAGTGGAADIALQNKVVAAELKLKHLKSKMRPSVREAASLIGMMAYRNIRTPSMIPSIVGMIVAGYNEDGTTELYSVEPAGGVVKIDDYDANFSSGMPFVLGLLERQYKKDMTMKEGVELAVEALKSSTQRDVGSGNGIDVFTITKDGIKQEVEQTIEPTYR
ncbi:MAG: proteasome subunit beta [Nanoarchaeota archaeon]|nr:proteasome subunit beta [Nanoarchaeota archaeon]